MKKSELRKEIKNRKRQFTSQQLSELSFVVVMRLLAHQRLKDARTVMLYYSLPDEVYTHTLVDALLASGKRVLLPRVTGEGTMELRCYTGPQSLEQGAYNIMEPVGEVFSDYAQIDLAVIPGVAFDRQLNRMGRGKGYYDRLLPQLGCAYKIGICFDFQLVESIECEEHDIRMDEVIAGEGQNSINAGCARLCRLPEQESPTAHSPGQRPGYNGIYNEPCALQGQHLNN